MVRPPQRSRKMAEKRLRRLRSAPRVTSITNDFGTATPMRKMKTIIPTKKTDSKTRGVPRPVLMHSIKVRSEPKTELPPSSRTTVLTLPERDTAPRMKVPRKNIDSSLALSSATIAVNNSGELSNVKRNHQSPIQYTKPSQIREKTTLLRGNGLSLVAGETHVWKLTNRGVAKSPILTEDDQPKLLVEGNQGVRISFMTMVGDPIEEFEIPPHAQPISLIVPQGTGLVTAIGLGGAGVIPNNLAVSPGGILPEISTFNRPGIGFQSSSTIFQVGPFNYLCRGSSFRVKNLDIGPARGKRFAFSALHVLDKQPEVAMFLPSTIDNLAILISGEGDGLDSLSIDLGDLVVTGKPHQIKRDGSILFLWDVSEEVEDASIVKVVSRVAEGWEIDSIVGLMGSYQNWLQAFTNEKWTSLVEEGPLTPQGDTILRWCDPKTLIPFSGASIQASNIKSNQTHIKLREEKSVTSLYDLGELEVDEEFNRDISNLADDDDKGDIITFRKQSGPEFLTITPEGIIQGCPDKSFIGQFEIIVSVVDLEGEQADARFYGTVIETNTNTAPYWKKERDN